MEYTGDEIKKANEARKNNIFKDIEKATSEKKTVKEKKIEKVMQEFKDGTLTMNGGKKVTSEKQALAIAINEADNL